MGSMSLSSSLCQRGRVGVKPRQPGWLGLAHDIALFCSAKATEDGCGHAGTPGHSDAGPAPGSWEVGVGGKGPLGKERVLAKGLGGAGSEIQRHLFHRFSSLPGGEPGTALHVVVFHLCSSGRGALWRSG